MIALRSNRTLKSCREVMATARDLLGRGYPAFVYGGPLERGQVPVFTFHSVGPTEFEADLRFLRENGYRTLSLAEFCDAMEGRRTPGAREVLLTFDDGFPGQMEPILPLLDEYESNATVFLIPGRISSGGAPPGSGAPAPAYLTWDLVEAWAARPRLDIGSHSLTHSLVFTAPEVVDFVSPGMASRFPFYEIPQIREGERDLSPGEIEFGTPIYRSAPRLGEAPRYHDDAALRSRVLERVRAGGGAAFFRSRKWRRELLEIVRRYRHKTGLRGRYETPEERESGIREEIVTSKALLESRLDGFRAIAFCYPWHVFSRLSVDLCREAGYRVSLIGRGTGGYLAECGGEAQRVPRIGEDFVRLLPGAGRLSLKEILLRKMKNRLRRGSPYLAH